MLLNYHIGRYVLGSLYVGDLVWLGWSGIRVAGFIKDQLDVTCYFISLLMCSTCLGH
jgi:hypothetical protein